MNVENLPSHKCFGMSSIGFDGLRIQGKGLVIIVVKVGIVGLGKQIAGVAHCQIQEEEREGSR